MAALRRFFRTTAVKLSLIYLVVFAGFIAFTILYLSFNVTALLNRQLNDTINAEIKGLAETYARGGLPSLIRAVERRSRQPGANLYLVMDPTGAVRVGNIARISPRLLQTINTIPQEINYRQLGEGADSTRHIALVRGFELAGGFKILVGRDVGERVQLEGVIRQTFFIAGGLLLFLGLITWAFVSIRVLKRIDAMAHAGQTIMAGDLSQRLPITGSDDEFDRLATSLNTMLARIEELMHGLKQVSDNIAHDLKTPLTRLRNRAESALREDQQNHHAALQDMIGEADQLIKIFNALLLIARIEAKALEEAMGSVNLADVARDVIELYEPVAEEQGVVLHSALPQEIFVYGNRELMAQALANLLDNALKYGADKTQIQAEGAKENRSEIHLLLQRNPDQTVDISICDHGPGIAEGKRKTVLQRFTRLDESRTQSGSGLGLNLVSAVAKMHNATMDLKYCDPETQTGLCVTLRFPHFAPIKGDESISLSPKGSTSAAPIL